MRTTVQIDDDLLDELQRRARDEPLSRVLNETIRRGLATPDDLAAEAGTAFRQQTFDLGRPSYDVDQSLSLADQWDDEERMRRMRDHPATERAEDV